MHRLLVLALATVCLGALPAADGDVSIGGELKQWHAITLALTGPASSETASPNPFLDRRFNVTFTGPSSQVVERPGYFAGDGAGGASGNQWHCHFTPDEIGAWSYSISFRSGSEVAVDLTGTAGSAVAPYDGTTGGFTVTASDKSVPDFRAPERGILRNRGHHYLTFASGDAFVKGGTNIPENLLGYQGFDNTPNGNHLYTAHVDDWNAGDPDWNGGDGRGIIGALNYLASFDTNTIYFLTMNVEGDGDDTYPTIAPYAKTQYDLSKLAQWDIVFAHAQAQGIFLHFVLGETEDGNETYHDNGSLGPQRKLYYRMLAARFGHHNALEWNIGEENDFSTANREAFAAYLKAVDGYDHPITSHPHNGKTHISEMYTPLLGNGDIDMMSIQLGNRSNGVFNYVQEWRTNSADAGEPWVICYDEPGGIEADAGDMATARFEKMWPAYLGGAGGFDWYLQQVGGGHGLDQSLDDFTVMAPALTYAGIAVTLLEQLPLTEMTSSSNLASSSSGRTWTLAKTGEVYLVYNDANGGPFTLDLSGTSGTFTVRWLDPRTGGGLQIGTVSSVSGGGSSVSLGSAPGGASGDWVCLVELDSGVDDPPVADLAVSPNSVATGDAVTFDASGSSDDGSIVEYVYDFGDGNSTTTTSSSVTHSYTAAGSYDATVTVEDDAGQTTESSAQTVTVSDPPPPGAGPFQESGGIVSMEAESGDFAAGQAVWTVVSDGNASGGEAIHSASNDVKQTPSSQEAERIVSYPIELAGGDYTFFVLVDAPSGSDDSFFFRLLDPSGNPVTEPAGDGWARWWQGLVGSGFEWRAWSGNDSGTGGEFAGLSAGEYTLEVTYRENGTVIDKFVIQDATLPAPTGFGPAESARALGQTTFGNDGQPWSISSQAPTRIEAEDYDAGGEGIAYHDNDADNRGGGYRSEGVDIQSTSDAGGGFNVGWIKTDEWLEYTIDVAQAGVYTVDIRVARQPTGDSALHLEVGGVDLSGAVAVPSTGDWQTWTTVGVEIELEAGEQVLRIAMDQSSFNVNWLEFTLAPTSPG